MADDSTFLVYGAPLVGVLLLTVGIAGGVMGGYSVVQQELDLCGHPAIHVASEEASAPYAEPGPPNVQRLPVSNLTRAERAAFEDALDAPAREAEIRGEVQHLEAFERGVLVTRQGAAPRYVTLATQNRCLDASPLLLPLGLVFMLVGTVGVLLPPILQRFETFESER
jgi:hypothetical protein